MTSPSIHAPTPVSPTSHRFLNPSPPAPNHSVSDSQADSKNELPLLQPYLSPKQYTFLTQNFGLILVAASQFFFVCMNLTVKYFLSITPITVPTLIAVRMSITAVCCVIALLVMGDEHPFLGPPDIRYLLALRGFAGFMGLGSQYMAFKGLSVSDAMSIQFLTPTLTTFLGFVLLGERSSIKEVVGGLCCLMGVVLISRPPFLFGARAEEGLVPPLIDDSAGQPHVGQSSSRVVAVAWAFISIIGSAAAYITIRRIGTRAHALHSTTYFSYLCSVVSVLIVLFTPGDFAWVSSAFEFALIILIGIFGFVAQMLLTTGLQRERVGKAGIAFYLSVFYAIVLELLVFHTFPAFLSLVGISIILTSAFWVAKSNMKKTAPDTVDVESQPISRTPSPNPPAGGRTLRGQHYSYASVPADDPDALVREHGTPNGTSNGDTRKKNNEEGKLTVRRGTIQRKGSSASNISGFTSTSGATSD